MDIIYECQLETSTIDITAKDEIKELIWMKRSEIKLESIGFVSIRSVIGQYYLL
jgi:hypothetical protein